MPISPRRASCIERLNLPNEEANRAGRRTGESFSPARPPNYFNIAPLLTRKTFAVRYRHSNYLLLTAPPSPIARARSGWFLRRTSRTSMKRPLLFCTRVERTLFGNYSKPTRQGGEIGRRARLRIAILSFSRHHFSLQNETCFTMVKGRFWRNSAMSRMASRSTVILAQILAQTRQTSAGVGSVFEGGCRPRRPPFSYFVFVLLRTEASPAQVIDRKAVVRPAGQ